MTSWVVADSNLILRTVLTESYQIQARALVRSWQQKVQIVVPTLFQYEIVAVLRKHVYPGKLSVEEAVEARNILLANLSTPLLASNC
jgi:predicted nucleic acid-binding protein